MRYSRQGVPCAPPQLTALFITSCSVVRSAVISSAENEAARSIASGVTRLRPDSVRILRDATRPGFATTTTSAAFLPHCEQRYRGANSMSVVAQATRRARDSGSISREAPKLRKLMERPPVGIAAVAVALTASAGAQGPPLQTQDTIWGLTA
jgi:hypothetical protein